MPFHHWPCPRGHTTCPMKGNFVNNIYSSVKYKNHSGKKLCETGKAGPSYLAINYDLQHK